MDYSSVDFEIIDSLDFLRPPVKRDRNINTISTVLYNQQDISAPLKGFSNKFTVATQYPHTQINTRDAKSSTSLIFNNTKDKVTNSVLSNTNLLCSKEIPKKHSVNTVSKQKPLIRVTVIPKATQTAQNPKKRSHFAKKIQTTVSNQENSIHGKNVYLVVPVGRKKEKVYQIKTTESAKFANLYKSFKDEIIPIRQLSSLKLILDSLNMERKTYKNYKRQTKSPSPEKTESPRTFARNMGIGECKCGHKGKGMVSADVSCSKSFVRVTGRLGLTDNDRYVLRCSGAIDDNPIATTFTGLGNSPPVSARREEKRYAKMCNVNTCTTSCYNTNAINFSNKRDSNIQTDLQIGKPCSTLGNNFNIMISKETQATQDDFNIGLSSELMRCSDFFPEKNEMAQCRCPISPRPAPSDSDSDTNSLKACKSPLVIISVYPMPDCPENVTVAEKYQNDNINCSVRKTILFNEAGNQRPWCENSNIKEKQNDSKVYRPISRSPSPSRNQNKNGNKATSTQLKTIRPNLDRQKPTYGNGRYTTAVCNKQTKTIKEKPRHKDNIREISPPGGPTSNKGNKGTNTDHNITKKIIVDNYTKKLTAYMDSKLNKKIRSPIEDTSKIAVDIDGEKEHYDVLFHKDNVTTGLKVKKTLKEPHSRNAQIETDLFPMMRNVLVPDEPRSPRVSRGEQLKDFKDDSTLQKSFSRLHLRDSLEISRRHDVMGKFAHVTSISNNNDGSSELFSASTKHYRGDNCSILDPIQRDKEIRYLLGIDKGIHTSAAQDGHKFDQEKYTEPPYHFYNNTCEKKIVPIFNVMRMPAPPCCCAQKSDTSRRSASSCMMQPKPPPGGRSPCRPSKASLSQSKCTNGCMPLSSQCIPVSNSQMAGRSYQNQQDLYMPSGCINGCVMPPQPQMFPQAYSQMASPKSFQSVHNAPSKPSKSQQPRRCFNGCVPPQMSPQLHSPMASPRKCNPCSLCNKTQNHNIQDNMNSFDFPITEDRRSMENNNTGTQLESTSLCQNLSLNHNIQVFLQVEQFCKQRPIVLTRQQYDKVKKTIESTIGNTKTNNHKRDCKRKKCVCKSSLVSVGDVRKKPNQDRYGRHEDIIYVTGTGKRDLGTIVSGIGKDIRNKKSKCACTHTHAPPTLLLYSKKENPIPISVVKAAPVLHTSRRAVSSFDLRYISHISGIKHKNISSINVEVDSTSAAFQQNASHSIHTIFKGHKKSLTPNLGTSLYSLCSEQEPQIAPPPQEPKKKPFLRRLMSCLVMRSTRISDENKIFSPEPKFPTVDSSIDSYHISTSLGAIEVTSSIYDTSASFYTNHSIYPINNKMKRGFFSSVREFLTNRKKVNDICN